MKQIINEMIIFALFFTPHTACCATVRGIFAYPKELKMNSPFIVAINLESLCESIYDCLHVCPCAFLFKLQLATLQIFKMN